MRRALWGLLTLAIVAAILAIFSLIWVAILVAAAVSIFIGRWQRLPEPWRELFALAVIGTIVGLLWLTGSTPQHYNPGSAASVRLFGVQRVVGPLPAEYASAGRPLAPNEAADLREVFRRAVFTLRSQANAAERALDLSDRVQTLVDQSNRLELPIRDVLDAKNAVGQALDEAQLNSAAALQSKVKELDAFLLEAETSAAQKQTAQDLQVFWTDFRLRSRPVSFSKLQDQVVKLENELNALERQVVTPRLNASMQSEGVLDEARNEFRRQFAVALTWRDVAVTWLDASELLLDREPGAREQRIFIVYPPSAVAETVADPRRIKVRSGPGVNSVTIVKETIIPADLKRLPARFRLPAFSYFMVRWPPPMPNQKLRATIDLSAMKGPEEFPYALDLNADTAIGSIRLPANAYYSSSYDFAPARAEGGTDVLGTQDGLKPSYFLTNGPVWVELMPSGLFFRNASMQGAKSYLFPENFLAGLAIVAFGVVWAWIVKGPK